MKIQTFIFLVFLAAVSCKNDETAETQVETSTTVAPSPLNPFDTLPVFPEEFAKTLFEKQNTLSINFLIPGYSPITVYGDAQSRSMLSGLLTYNKPNNPVCQNPMGTFSSSGPEGVLAQGSIFFQQGCTYLIFQDLETNQYSYICQMGNNGINTLNQILQNQTQSKSQGQ